MKRILELLIFPIIVLVLVEIGYSQISHTVIIGDGGSFSFSPANLTISSGDTVNWEWQANNHSTTSDAIAGTEVWDSGIQNNGASYSKVFIENGIYPYHCTPHQSFGMVGVITVETALEVNEFENGKVESFMLGQNFPNPFNPVTHIQYIIPNESLVIITVYDLLGNDIKTLLNDYQTVGQHHVSWDAKDDKGRIVSGGVYLYNIQARDFSQTNKMVLLK